MDSSDHPPSGSVLPLFLRRKWRDENSDASNSTKLDPYPSMSRAARSRVASRIFTAREVEDKMQQISKNVLVNVQKQIQRGEESYWEDTSGHGNLYKGWDSFVDARDIGTANAPTAPQGARRMPADNRWFSTSYIGRARPLRASPGTPRATVSPPAISARMESSTVASTTSPATETKKPTAPDKSSSSDATEKKINENEKPKEKAEVTKPENSKDDKGVASSKEDAITKTPVDTIDKTVRDSGTKRKKRDFNVAGVEDEDELRAKQAKTHEHKSPSNRQAQQKIEEKVTVGNADEPKEAEHADESEEQSKSSKKGGKTGKRRSARKKNA